MTSTIAIIDYGAGNTANVKNAFDKLGITSAVTSDVTLINGADAIVLPGVGSFGAAMEKLESKRNELAELIKEKPFLGICLGMQLLFEQSEESKGVRGFGLLNGTVKKFKGNLPVPHTGWNKVNVTHQSSAIFDGINEFYAYFVHSYYCAPADKSAISASTDYGISFPSVISVKNLFLTQFHPEKSGEKGLMILNNFVRSVRR
jgi:glutamine amidotransferase